MEDMERVYREYMQTVFRFLVAKTGSAQLAEELTQETFYQAVRSIHRYDGTSRMTTWLCGIARNVLLAHFRKSKTQPLPLDDHQEDLAVSSAEEDALATMDRDAVLSALERIPEPGREVLRLRALGGLSFRRVGEILGRTENWARVTYYRAKLIWRKELTDETSVDL